MAIRPDRLTLKAQEAFRDSLAEAKKRGNPVANDAHLLAELLRQEERVVRPLLQKAGVDVATLAKEIEREIGRFPKQQGDGGEPTFSRELNTAFDRAEKEAEKLGDAYIALEHLLIGLADTPGTAAKGLLSAAGVTTDDLRTSMAAVRGSHRVAAS